MHTCKAQVPLAHAPSCMCTNLPRDVNVVKQDWGGGRQAWCGVVEAPPHLNHCRHIRPGRGGAHGGAGAVGVHGALVRPTRDEPRMQGCQPSYRKRQWIRWREVPVLDATCACKHWGTGWPSTHLPLLVGAVQVHPHRLPRVQDALGRVWAVAGSDVARQPALGTDGLR